MNANKILLAGLIGGVVFLVIGYLLWGMALTSFFDSHRGSASGVMRADEDMQWVPLILGNITWGLLIAIIFGRWAGISTFATGAKAGALIGFLMSFSYDMINFATANLMDFTGAIVNTITMAVVTALVGGVIGWFLGRGN